MHAVVTGAKGFIGSALCRELRQQGWQIRALVLPGESSEHIACYIAEKILPVLTGEVAP